jgi:hypothetical protein
MTGQFPTGLTLEKYPAVIGIGVRCALCGDAGYRGTFFETVTEDFGIFCDIVV